MSETDEEIEHWSDQETLQQIKAQLRAYNGSSPPLVAASIVVHALMGQGIEQHILLSRQHRKSIESAVNEALAPHGIKIELEASRE